MGRQKPQASRTSKINTSIWAYSFTQILNQNSLLAKKTYQKEKQLLQINKVHFLSRLLLLMSATIKLYRAICKEINLRDVLLNSH